MREFAELAREAHARFPIEGALWTWYHLTTHPYPRCDSDWGVCLAYHFDRGYSIESWLELIGSVHRWVESRPELHEIIKVVPFYEIGTDFVAQCKPTYDGGYPTTAYEEFLQHGDCEPPPGFYRQLAELHQRVAEAVRLLPSDPEDNLLKKVVHATFIKPYRHLFWADQKGWLMYHPNIDADDLREHANR